MSMWIWFLGLAYACGAAALWPKSSRWSLRHDMEGQALNARLMRQRAPEAGTADYILAALGGFMLALVWPIWGGGIALGRLGMLLGKWLFPVLREGGCGMRIGMKWKSRSRMMGSWGSTYEWNKT